MPLPERRFLTSYKAISSKYMLHEDQESCRVGVDFADKNTKAAYTLADLVER